MTIRAVVFDFDGVIVESEGAKTEAFRDLFARLPEERDAMLRFHEEHRSAPRRVKLAELARRLGRADDASFLAALERELSRSMLERVSAASVVPGARELLAELAPRALVAVASVTPVDDLHVLLARHGLADHVALVYGDPPTAKAEAVRDVVARAGGDPAEVVLVGDAPADLDVARTCGVRFVRRDSGLTFGPDAPAGHPDLHGVAVELRAMLR